MKKYIFSKTAISLAIAFSVCGLVSESMAQGMSMAERANKNGSLVEVGKAKNLSNLKGFAKDLPLITVLKQITPNEWVVKKSKGKEIDLQKSVSWSGGKNWVETLKEVAVNNNIDVLVNWDKKEVFLADVVLNELGEKVVQEQPVVAQYTKTKVSTVKTTQSVGVFELSEVVTEGNSGQVENNVAEVTQVVQIQPEVTQEIQQFQQVEQSQPAPEVQQVQIVQQVEPPVMRVKTWGFQGLDNLKEAVESWGTQAGYKVVYTGENYPIDTLDTRILTGDFDAENGPIKQLSVDYGPTSRVKKPLSFIFFQNRTLLVEDLRFEQAGYPQYIKR